MFSVNICLKISILILFIIKFQLMKSIIKFKANIKIGFILIIGSCCLLNLSYINAQNATILPGNSNYSQLSSPQGGLRYERGFYLITPKEVIANGLTNGMVINSIGFTQGVAQNVATKGAFKVYLQNSSDLVSRVDTSWTNLITSGNSYNIPSGMDAGSYEWQVRAVCGSNSPFSTTATFANDNLGPCILPSNISTTNITSTSATFNWEAPTSTVTNYVVEYKNQDSNIWQTATSTGLSYTATDLVASKFYQWRVKAACASNSSEYISTLFSTNNTNVCSSPSALTLGTIGDTTAVLNWVAAIGASYYTVQYRRIGTVNWLSTIAFTNSATLNSSLIAGTKYEWQVRTTCVAGAGAFIAGPSFTTTGTLVCYPPINLTINSLSESSGTFKWNAVDGATGYELRYRLKETITWSNVINPMTLVHNDSLKITNKGGAYDVPFIGGSSFTYTGQGIYVGWEYSNSSRALSSLNTTVSTNANTVIKNNSGVDSLRFILGFYGKSNLSIAGLPLRLQSSNLRPETRLGSTALKDSVEVVAVYALGKTAPNFLSPTPISALISNKSNTSATYPVTLTVKDQRTNTIRFTETKNLVVSAKDSGIVSFSGWSPSLLEKDTVAISIPMQTGENVINNNVKAYLQTVTNSYLGYDDGSSAIASSGFGTGAGLLLNKYTVKGCAKVIAAQIFLSESAKNHGLYAVILNSAGALIAQSPVFTPDSLSTNIYQSFYFNTPQSFQNTDFYIGLAQTSSTISYMPVSTQREDAKTRTGAYYRANLDATGLIDYPIQGRLMINAEIVPSGLEPAISGNLVLCSGSTTTLTAASIDQQFASKVVGFSSQNSNVGYTAKQVLGTPNVYPNYGVSTNAWISNTPDGQREYLILGFANAQAINFVDIYETANTGAVDTVFVKNPTTLAWDMVYSRTATAASPTSVAKKTRISFPITAYSVSEIRIAINSLVVAGYNTIDAVSIGKIISPDATFSSYLWSPGGEITNTKTVSTSGTYKLTTTNSLGCQFSETVKVVDALTTPPTILAGGPTTFCQGDSVLLTSSQNTGNVWSNGATTKSIRVKNAGSYTVSYNDGSGCTVPTSVPTIININPLPVITITGTLGICPSSNTTLDAGAGFSSYRWSTSATTRTISVTSASTYTVTVTNGNGCKATASASTTASTSPVPTISGATVFCQGSSTTLDAGAGFSSYSWSTGASTRKITVNTAANFSVTVTNASGCVGTNSINTSFYTPPNPSISGNSDICSGGSTTLTANIGYVGYSWSTGTTSQSIPVNVAGTYTLTVSDANGCTASINKIVAQVASPIPVISGTLSFCGSSSTTLEAGLGYSSYAWSNGATTHSIIVSTAGIFSITVTNASGCTGAASVTTTTVGAVPASPGPITGNNGGVCNSSNNVYSIATVLNTAFYVWTVPAGATIVSGQGTTSISVNYGNTFSSGDIIVAASNACGQSPSNTPRKLFITSIATTPGAITGQASGLCGQLNKVYSITNVAGANSYLWTVPTGATIVSGQGTTTIAVNFANNFGTGNICVKTINVCGNSANNCLALQGIPSMPTAINGPISVCAKESNVVYSVAPGTGVTTYYWSVSNQGKILSGQGTTSIVVEFLNKNVDITVIANNGCGGSAKQLITVNVGCATNKLALNEDYESNKVNIFPNPSDDILNIKVENGFGIYNFKAINILGQLSYENDFLLEDNKISVDLKQLPKGVYIGRISNDKFNKSVKFILK